MMFLFRRLGFYGVALWVAVSLNFLIPRLMPGDPATRMFNRAKGKMSAQALEGLKEAFGFTDGDLLGQYIQYIKALSNGDLGISMMFFPEPVAEKLLYATYWTLFLAGTGTLISFVMGTLLGSIAAMRRGGRLDVWGTPLAVVLQSATPAVVALFLFWGFAIEWQLFPLGRAYNIYLTPSFSVEFISSALYYSALPLLSIILVSLGQWHFTMRNNMIGILDEDYLLLAKAKGLSENRILIHYAARNAILPNINAFAMAIGLVLAGSLFTEVVFNYPGLGLFVLKAIQAKDYAFIQGQLLFVTIGVLVSNFLGDLLNVSLDPRLRQGGAR
jgi:peptide/nickel transport system permease protein